MNAKRSTAAWLAFDRLKARHRLVSFLSPQVMTIDFRSENSLISYTRLKRLAKGRPIALVSPAGTGKTTLLLKLVEDICVGSELQPVFLPLADLAANETIENFLERNAPEGVRPEELACGQYLLAWDGVNEAQRSNLAELIRSIRSFHKNSIAPYFLSCRPDEYPLEVTTADESEVQIAPLNMEKVLAALQSLFLREGCQLDVQETEGLICLSRLCRVPLFFGMVVTSVSFSPKKRRLEIIQRFLRATSSADVYREFVAHTLVREERKGRAAGYLLPAPMREFILGRLGFAMQQAELVYWEQADFEAAIRRTMREEGFKRLFPDLVDERWQAVIDQIRRSPPVQVIPAGRDTNKVGFMHQSVGEYFAAVRLLHAQRDGEDWKTNLFLLLNTTSKRNWPTIEFAAGFRTLHNHIIEYVADVGMQSRRQELLVLAARCVTGHVDERPIVIEDLQVRMMEAFKNWGKPFDYDLVHELGEMGSRGVRRPRTERIRRDIERFVAKYSEFRPVALSHPPEHLVKLVEHAEESEAACAAYSLGVCAAPVPSEMLLQICQVFEARSSWRIREQILTALKERGDPATVDFVASIVASPPSVEATRTQVFALNALAQIGDISKIDVLLAYLRDKGRPFRDSAAWSIQRLVLKARDQGRLDIVESSKRILLAVLLGEDRTSEWRYLAGNILYTLGLLNAFDVSDRLVDWASGIDDAYVLEDLIYGLGLMGEAKHVPFIETYTVHVDPAVRLKAIEALGLIGAVGSREAVRRCLMDEFPVVQHMAVMVDRDLASRA